MQKIENEYYGIYHTIIGEIKIINTEKFVMSIELCNEEVDKTNASLLTNQAAKELEEYFQKKRKKFDIPLKPDGTEFQKKVWSVLQEIPYGETWSYKKVAEKIGNPKAYRAVGMANNKNPIIIVIPCHRVIGIDGTLVGYGAGLDIKERLLALENKEM